MRPKQNQLNIMILVSAVIVVLLIGGLIFFKTNNKKEDVAPKQTVEEIPESEESNIVVVSDAEETITKPAEEILSEEEEYSNDPTHLFYDPDAQSGYLNHCIFLGDSRTVAAKDNAVLNDADALCQVGINHISFMSNVFLMYNGTELTMTEYLRGKTAEVIYISLGVNGINSIDDANYKSGYKQLIAKVKELCPNSTIVIEAIWPVEDDGLYASALQNKDVDRYNEFLKGLAVEEGCYYLNIDSILKADDGTMKDEYDGGDGLHYSKSSYSVIFDYIIHHPVPGVDTSGEYVVHFIAAPAKRGNVEDGFATPGDISGGDSSGENATSENGESSNGANSQDTQDDGEPAPGEDLGMPLIDRIHAYGIPSGNLDDGTELFLYDNKLYTSGGSLYLNVLTGEFGPGFEYIAEQEE